MVKAVGVALFAFAQAGNIVVTWQDCGTASTHGKITNLQPTTIRTGTATTVVGTGTLDEQVTGGTFNAVIKASGVQVASCSGDASKDIVCKLPLGTGSITVKALPFPLAGGTISVNAQVSTSALIPTSLAVTSTHVTAFSTAGDDLVCLDLNTNAGVSAMEEEVQGSPIAVTWQDCGTASTHGKITNLQPTTIQTGTAATVVGTGTLDEQVTGGTFKAVIKASGVQVASCSGDASKDIVCNLPLGTGSITVKALPFPLAAGTISVNAVVSTSALIPASLAVTSTHVTAASPTGDSLVCLDITTNAGVGSVSV